VYFVFSWVAPLFCFSLVSLVLTEVLEKIGREVTRKVVEAVVSAAKVEFSKMQATRLAPQLLRQCDRLACGGRRHE
jgi:hypothetical protein